MGKTLRASDGTGSRGIGIWLDVNNGQHLELEQPQDDGNITVRCMSGDTINRAFVITPGDMVMMLNWCQHQKANGNYNLVF